jgi:hypothetical protein
VSSPEPDAKALRLRLYRDFPFYAENALHIRTKDATITKLTLNRAQRRLMEAIEKQWAETGKVRIIVLKARQMGLSTVIGAWLYWRTSQNSAQKTMVLAHKAEATQTLFDMTKRFHDMCPPLLKPSTKYAGRRELAFDRWQSSYAVATAGGDGVGRSETLTGVHASEVAFWPTATAQENWNGLIQAVPNSPGTAVFVESTANGVTGTFFDLWNGAVDGSNGFIAVFLPWFIQSEYAEEPPPGFEMTPDEEDLVAAVKRHYGETLTPAQLFFRRRKIAETSKDKFKQEYPSFPEEAFLTTGMPVFNPETLLTMERTHKAPPARRLALVGSKWDENPRGDLLEWAPPVPGKLYWVGADVAAGIPGRDYSVAQVLDEDKKQVAKFRAHVHPDYYAEVLVALARRYNDARVAVESNNHGILTNNRLAKEFGYENLYIRETVDKLNDMVRQEPGFATDVKTKPLIIDQLRAEIRDSEITIHDENTYRELRTFIVTPGGKLQAEEGQHDDEVMSLAIANHIHEGKFRPIEVPDDAYYEAI